MNLSNSSSSTVVTQCQICDEKKLESVLFLGYLPPVNLMPVLGSLPKEEPSYPAQMLYCPKCKLVQLGLIVDPKILFPPEYPYTSGSTKILREDFAELYQETSSLVDLTADDLVVDIGSNDGTLLSNFFKGGHRVQGIEPSERGNIANDKGMDTLISFFGNEYVEKVLAKKGKAKIITATNVFAHIQDVHEVLKGILKLLKEDGVFISESHYLYSLVETLQYDTIYHEHLRYYSLLSLKYLLEHHNLEIFHAKRIPTHGGSIRVYAARKGHYPSKDSVNQILDQEMEFDLNLNKLKDFKEKVIFSKLALHSLLYDLKKTGKRIYGIGAPSRASTLINYVGIDDGIMDCVLEIKGSFKIGKYIPGTLIPVFEESRLYEDPPDYALLLSWHIADELMPKLIQKGFRGDFIIPLPNPRIVKEI